MVYTVKGLHIYDRRKKLRKMSSLADYRECICTFFIAELIFFLYKVASSMLEPTTRLYIYRAVCLNLYSNSTLHSCSDLSSDPVGEAEVQRVSGQYINYYKLLLNGPAIFLGFFCGAWSDIVGRKLPIMIPCLGTILAVLMYMVSLQYVIPPLWLILVGSAINGCFGKSAVITMALHSYAADISDKDSRTKKLGKLLSMNFFGYFVGSLIAGALLDAFTFNIIFVVVVAILSLIVLITVAFMKEPLKGPPLHVDEHEEPSPLKSLFRVENVKDSLKILVRKREDRDRSHLIYFFLFIITFQTCKSGEVDAMQLFVKRSPLNWPDFMYGYLLATDYACLGLAVILLLPILTHYAHFTDVMLVIFAIVFKTLRLVILCYSDHTWLVYLSVVLGAPSAMMMSGLKSLISKTVNEDELGKAFSLLASGETIASMIGSIVFLNVYNVTAFVFPGLVFGIDAVFFIILLIIFMFVSYSVKITDSVKFLRNLTAQKQKQQLSANENNFVDKFAEIFDDASTIQRTETGLMTVFEEPDENKKEGCNTPEKVTQTASSSKEEGNQEKEEKRQTVRFINEDSDESEDETNENCYDNNVFEPIDKKQN